MGLSTLPGYEFTSRTRRPLLTNSDPLLGSASACRSCQGCGLRSALWRLRTHPLEPIALPRPAIPSWAFGLVQSSVRSAGIAVMGSAIPVRRCLSARPSGFPIRPSWVDGLVSAHAPLFEFRGPSGLSRTRLAAHPQVSAPPLDFRPLRHMQQSRSGSPGHCLARHLPSSGFGYPRDGFLPRLPCPPYFMRAAPMGFTLRSILLA